MTAAKTLRDPKALLEAGLIAPERLAGLERVAARYAVAITPALAELIDPTDPNDPIALQFVPQEAELEADPAESADPIGDAAFSPVEGIVHRYPDRVLLKITHTCATYCRFCFRREMVGPAGLGALSPAQLDAALAYVAARPNIWEVIVTGGDPFVLSPRRLAELMDRLARIDHVKIVRFHTRVPAVDPALVTDELVAALKAPGKAVYVALHANHPRELTPAARAACARIIDAGVPMVSQTVLLKGVNDDAAVMKRLMHGLLKIRVKPYYLYQCDPISGSAHFRTPVEKGLEIIRALRGHTTGYAVPTYVIDAPGGGGKVPLIPDYVVGRDGEDLLLTNFENGLYRYRDPGGIVGLKEPRPGVSGEA